MKIQASTEYLVEQLRSYDNSNWSYNGALALVNYLEKVTKDLGEELIFDLVGLRCDYSEYPSLREWAIDTGFDDSIRDLHGDDYSEDDIRQFVQDRGTLLEFEGGIIISAF